MHAARWWWWQPETLVPDEDALRLIDRTQIFEETQLNTRTEGAAEMVKYFVMMMIGPNCSDIKKKWKSQTRSSELSFDFATSSKVH